MALVRPKARRLASGGDPVARGANGGGGVGVDATTGARIGSMDAQESALADRAYR